MKTYQCRRCRTQRLAPYANGLCRRCQSRPAQDEAQEPSPRPDWLIQQERHLASIASETTLPRRKAG